MYLFSSTSIPLKQRTLSALDAQAQTKWLAEAFVEGSEVNVEAFFQNGEITFSNCIDYLHQWRKSAVPAK